MSELERRIEELEAQLAELKASVGRTKPRRGSVEAAEEVNRRALLRVAGS